jgi:hypothetical protein
MKRFLLRWLIPLLILTFGWLPAVQAQSEGEGTRTYAGPYAMAFLATIIILVIVCTPSRKR